MDTSRFYTEVEGAKARVRAFQQEAEIHRLLRQTNSHPLWRSALAAQLRRVAQRLEPQTKAKGIL